MRKKVTWMFIGCLVLTAMILSSCGKTTAPLEQQTTTAQTTTTAKPSVAPSTTVNPTITPTTTTKPSVEEKLSYGGTLTLSRATIITTFEPNQAGNDSEYYFGLVYERLGQGNWKLGNIGDMTFISKDARSPCLAISWEQVDPTHIVFHLRQGVRFQDIAPVNGRELTADDVAYSFNRYIKEPIMASQARQYLAEVKALDKYTVQFTSNQPHCDLMTYIGFGTGAFIFTPEMVSTFGNLQSVKATCGTGPFILTDMVPGSSMTYKKNPNYWGYDELNPKNKLPYVDTVNYLIITDDATTMSAMRTGKIDMLEMVFPENAKALFKSNPELKSVRALDQAARSKVMFRHDLAPFKDLKVRQAMSMAIDRDSIVKDFLLGEGVDLSYPILADWKEIYTPIKDLPPDIKETYTYNPEKAKKLLAEAGFPNGFETEIMLNEYQDRAELLANYWAKIGIKCKITLVDRASFTSTTYGIKYPQMVYAKSGHAGGLGSMEYYIKGAYYNYGRIDDPFYDKSIKDIQLTFDDAEKNRKLKELNIYFLGKVYLLSFPFQYCYNIWQPWMKNYHGEGILNKMNVGGIIARVSIDQAAKKASGN